MISVKKPSDKFLKSFKDLLRPDVDLKNLLVLAIFIVYWVVLIFFDVFRSSHFFIGILLSLLSIYNKHSKTLFYLLLPFALTGIVYDNMRFFISEYRSPNIHIKDLYLLEKSLFGINYQGELLTPNEYLSKKTNLFLDIVTGFTYICFTLEYILISLLILKNKMNKVAILMAWGFFVVNILGFITYFIYPAAPPWYILEYGINSVDLTVPGSPAGTIRFDNFFNIDVFKVMYSNSSNVFGAVPSLHVAYPFLAFLFTMKIKKWRILALSFSSVMFFSSIYLYHHYIIDALLGLIYALVSFILLLLVEKTQKR